MAGTTKLDRRKGFKPKSRIYSLRWAEDHELHGLEVEARALRWGDLLTLGALVEDVKGSPTEQVNAMGELHRRFGKALVGWNRAVEEDSDELLPASAEGLEELEDWEFMAVLDAYMGAAVGVADPLPNGSGSGGRSLAELPMTDP